MTRTTTGARYASRYAAAVARSVPASARDDVRAEVEAAVADQVEPRMEAGEGRDDAERAVVAALGDPIAYAASLTDRPLWLIGPRYYAPWLRLLRLLLIVAIPCIAVGVSIATLLQGGGVGDVIGAIIAGVLQGAVQIAFWTTLVFVILERTGSSGEGITEWSPDQLPTLESRGAAVSDFAATAVMAVILAGTVLWDRFLGWGPQAVHVFAFDLWPGYGIGLLAVLTLTVLVAGVVLVRGRWTVPLVVANVLLAAVTAVAALILIWQHRLLHPDLTALFGAAEGTVVTILDVVLTVMFLGVLFGAASDGFRRLRRGRTE
ncbi:hypothetical protein J2Y69_001929 [Microbacterium resistens]|uniref:Integral membrane protein n=1 Tax=Microbacterium resistens TaxID=156977 RepID=A0ABU1SCJ6_9MICO|nr:hypothetical protein [Microbacterium resistens]MDR6867328.1 hypothetical protein [Microbacterium resistens]